MKTIQEKGEKPRSKRERIDVIPDYDYLFAETENKKGKKKNKFFGKIVKMNFWPLFFSSLLYVLQAAPLWLMPLVTSDIIDAVALFVSGELAAAEVLKKVGIDSAILAVALAQNVPTTVCRNTIVSKMLRTTSAGIKSCVVRKLQSLSITYAKDMETGRIQSKFLKDTDAADTLFSTLVQSIIPNVISALIAVGIAVFKNGIVALFFLCVIPCNVAISRLFNKRLRARYRDLRLQTEGMSNRLSAMLEMLTITKAHGLEQTEIDAVNRAILGVAGSGVKVDKTSAYFGSSSWVLNNMLSCGCVVFCAVLAVFGKISVGDIVLYQSMFVSITSYVSALANLLPTLGAGFEALSSVSEIMNATDVEMNIGKRSVPSIRGDVVFQNVYYKYPGAEEYTVKNFSIDVKAGECIAVVGSSGSGKSTLMNLIIGFLKPVSGRVLIDGKPLDECNLSEYRHHISVVPQNSILFAGTIRENITYGLSRYTEEELQKAVELADLTDLIKTLPHGVDTDIGEHGDKLSGGQKQRITIARALIRNPAVLIFDEATSALDNISEYHVQKAISSSIKGRTTFIVAHRLSTIRGADRILVMERGECVEAGTYEELMAKKGRFYELKSLNDMNSKMAEEALA
ncbi:MAG: ABC transporter ATP-binding protein [Candidatus Borkfalkiaceae bacterium]|nr:ABC transporter ATP-binding protein [Clostridia bacterium]MDY6223811.1 ABC transporter ATP-binding protein [Christensenellaceae bacterium]